MISGLVKNLIDIHHQISTIIHMHETLIKKVHNINKKIFIAATGGGTSFLGEFLKVPGGSKVMLGGITPYDQNIFNEFIDDEKGTFLTNYASIEAASSLAVASFEYVKGLNKFKEDEILGIGITCSLVKENERPDRLHKIYISFHTIEETFSLEFILKQKYNRIEEENIVNYLTIQLLIEKYINKNQITKELVQDCIHFLPVNFNYVNEINIFENKNKLTNDLFVSDNLTFNDANTIGIFPGSFNPLHSAHAEIKNTAQTILNIPIFYELSRSNWNKPTLSNYIIDNRVSQLGDNYIITDALFFVDKINVLKSNYPNKKFIFICGADTWNRIFHGLKHEQCTDIEDLMRYNRVNFLVFGRKNEYSADSINKNYGSDLIINDARALNYNNGISSTEIRNSKN